MPLATQPGCRAERGYVLLTLMLFVALLAILSLGWIEKVDFQIKRDREEELIHRGVQYSRAVRRFFKKFGRYPTRIEELEETNKIRFLRKHYQDPITGKDFKLLHMGEVQSSFNPAAASGLPPGAAGATAAAAQTGAFGASSPADNNTSGSLATSASQSATPESGQAADQSGGTAPGQTDQGAANAGGAAGSAQASSPQGAGSASSGGKSTGDHQLFGGGPIVGVVSTSKEKSIREFNKKDHYNQWQFIYDPSIDRGGLLMTPNQPPLQGAVTSNPQQNAQPGNTPQGQNPGIGASGAGTNGPEPPPQSPPQQQQ
jgi:type II secretory pathway pseudopilin PulG